MRVIYFFNLTCRVFVSRIYLEFNFGNDGVILMSVSCHEVDVSFDGYLLVIFTVTHKTYSLV